MLTLDACHVPLSIAVASNVPGYESGVCFVTEESEEQLVQELMDYLESLSEVSYKLILQKFDYVIQYKNLIMLYKDHAQLTLCM